MERFSIKGNLESESPSTPEMAVFSYFVFVAFAFYAGLLPWVQPHRVHHILKRALTERNLTDPGGCVQNCFIRQNRAVAEEGNSTNANGSLHRNSKHPAVRGCEIHNVAADCLKNCPSSAAKAVYLDSILTETVQCSANPELLKAQWDCVSNESLVAEIKICNSKCPSLLLGLTESLGLSPNTAQVVFVNYENDWKLVDRQLNESCSSAACLWPCLKPIVEQRCGKAIADHSNAINKAEIQSAVNTFIDLNVIDHPPAECRKYLAE